MYEQTPIELAMAEGQSVPEDQAKTAIRHFEDFFEEVFQGIYSKQFKRNVKIW
jgi:hypothetical protein